MTTTPIIKRIDHILIRIDDPDYKQLFLLLYDTFQLPVAWPVLAQPSFKSGGIFAGNVNLEIIRFGPPQDAAPLRAASPTQLYGIVFELYSPTESLNELTKRRIPHTPAIPYMQPETEAGGKKMLMWTNAILGKLLSDNPLANLFISLVNLAPKSSFENASSKVSLGGRSWTSKLLERAFRDGIIYTVDYNREFVDVDTWDTSNREALSTRQGGPLGLESVKEVILGVTDFEEAQKRWQNFFSPTLPVAPGLWPVGDGPAIHLVPHSQNVILALVLKVASLKKAEAFLSDKGLLGAINRISEDEIRIAPEKIFGLDVRLVDDSSKRTEVY